MPKRPLDARRRFLKLADVNGSGEGSMYYVSGGVYTELSAPTGAGTFVKYSGGRPVWTSAAATDRNAIHDNVANEIAPISALTAPTGNDYTIVEDFSDGNAKRSVQIGDFPVIRRNPDALKHGWVDRTETVLSFVDGTRTLTLALDSGVSGADYFVDGTKYTMTATKSATISDAQGAWFAYLSGPGDIITTQTPWSIDGQIAFITTLYWDATGGTSYESLTEERHESVMDAATHKNLHDSRGAKVGDGLEVSWTAGNGSLDAHAQIALTNGDVHDEDIQFDITNAAAPSANGEQILAPTAHVPVFYRAGADAGERWVKSTADAFPLLNAGGGRMAYNENNAGTWQQTEITNGRFGVMWLVYTTRLSEPVFVVQGQAEYNKQANAESALLSDLSLGGLYNPEIVYAYQLVYQTSNGFGNTPKSRLVNVLFLTVESPGGSINPPGTAGGDLSGTYPTPQVVGVTEGSGTSLSVSAVTDGTYLYRSGNTIVGNSAGGASTTWTMPLSGTVDLKTALSAYNGTLLVSGATSAYDIITISGNELVMNIQSASGGNKRVDVVVTGLTTPPLDELVGYKTIVCATCSALGRAAATTWNVRTQNPPEEERALIGQHWDGSNRRLFAHLIRNAVGVGPLYTTDPHWNSVGNKFIGMRGSLDYRGTRLVANSSLISAVAMSGGGHVRAGGTHMHIRCNAVAGGGNISVRFHTIKVCH